MWARPRLADAFQRVARALVDEDEPGPPSAAAGSTSNNDNSADDSSSDSDSKSSSTESSADEGRPRGAPRRLRATQRAARRALALSRARRAQERARASCAHSTRTTHQAPQSRWEPNRPPSAKPSSSTPTPPKSHWGRRWPRSRRTRSRARCRRTSATPRASCSGGCSSYAAHGAPRELWGAWLDNKPAPEPTQLRALNPASGHCCLLGARDIALARFAPFVELPPAWPLPPEWGDTQDSHELLRLAREALRRPSALKDLVAPAERDMRCARLVSEWLRDPPDPSADEGERACFHVLAFLKLALLANETLDPPSGHGAGVDETTLHGGLLGAFVYRCACAGEVTELQVSALLSAAVRARLCEPSPKELAAHRDALQARTARGEQDADGDGARTPRDLRPEQALARHAADLTHARTLARLAALEIELQGAKLAGACEAVLRAIGAWLARDGEMHRVLLEVGRAAAFFGGRDFRGRLWGVGALHGGTALDPRARRSASGRARVLARARAPTRGRGRARSSSPSQQARRRSSLKDASARTTPFRASALASSPTATCWPRGALSGAPSKASCRRARSWRTAGPGSRRSKALCARQRCPRHGPSC